jgi:peptidoglycan hydrolase-like amidase
MRCSLVSKTLVFLIANSLSISSFVFAQQRPRDETRPRRILDQKQGPKAAPDEWKPETTTIIADPAPTTRLEQEPTMRIALATDVRLATVSTTGHLMSATDVGTTLIPLDVARVRVEPRLLSPLPVTINDETFRLRIAGLESRAEADEKSNAIRDATAEESQIAFDATTKTWGLLVGPRRSHDAVEEARARLEDAGFVAAIVDLATQSATTPLSSSMTRTDSASSTAAKSNSTLASASRTINASAPPSAKPGNVNSASQSKAPISSNIRLASRASVPTRELITSTAGTGKLFSSSAPVMFASDDEAKAPVRFNDKPYRGRIEVFANTRGLLTVVNVIGLEDYVRGVVANELSPGGYPAIEALKAQAIAARTYALRNRGQFASQGFDLLPTTRSQVYRGLLSEHPLSTRAVDETRGMIATYNGEPINALYTSTCGGRTEDSENIFNQAVPYLRGRECAVEGRASFAPFAISTSREPAELREEKHIPLARDVALLGVQSFASLPTRVSDSWLSAPASVTETQNWLASVARLAKQTAPAVAPDVNRPPAFATALNAAVFGERHADTLLNNADVEYFLAIHDATEVPAANRADVATLVRDGYLSLFPDVTLRPREPMSRARVLRAISRLLENRGLLQVQRAIARPTSAGTLVLRSTKGKDQPIRVSSDAYLFRQIGDVVYPVRSVVVVGGEPVTFHLGASGEVDYLEVRPAPNGAAADRFSPFTHWSTELSLGQVQSRLSHAARGVGPITNLRVAARGSSRRVIDLEIIGAEGTTHLRGGGIRSALGLREQLFVIDREYDSEGRVTGFVFTGRGWGHGVGMCQVGAYGLARQGWSFEQILKAYYTGIELTKMY